ncbi:GAF and ANTAR domain-containing protein [Demequina activiva]|uniref:Transcriptional regulator n=1 Tax=Demequina activiva TaxID=1582364 RepID=A0A919Q3P8_9MICO|nr:GAF and ANTAR domain-containing protein [Demequina activiva]GIG54336.1 transcriptional regulator [Demequina activiva]
MDAEAREQRISAAFVAAADTLTAEFDEVELLHTVLQDCVEILGMKAGGLLLADADGKLQLLTSTGSAAAFVEVMQLGADAGPCIDCYDRGERVSVSDIEGERERWPEFSRAAVAQGFRSALATPMRLRGRVIGSMNLFGEHTGHVSDRDAALAQALADVATIGLLQERLVREGKMIEEQLQRALDTRVAIEQAKGVIAGSLSVSMDEAFGLMRTYSRDRNLTLHGVAQSLSARELTAHDFRVSAEQTAT